MTCIEKANIHTSIYVLIDFEGTDMGEFQFEILREYRGEMTMVGESVAITGIMLNKDEIFGDKGRLDDFAYILKAPVIKFITLVLLFIQRWASST